MSNTSGMQWIRHAAKVRTSPLGKRFGGMTAPGGPQGLSKQHLRELLLAGKEALDCCVALSHKSSSATTHTGLGCSAPH